MASPTNRGQSQERYEDTELHQALVRSKQIHSWTMLLSHVYRNVVRHSTRDRHECALHGSQEVQYGSEDRMTRCLQSNTEQRAEHTAV